MNTDLENPYLVLGVERTADDRAIKKAYVALVRKFPPEKHPEDFKRIRAAYELLLNADARARFDDGEKGYAEYGEELSKRLEDADQAMNEKNLELAREILKPLAERFPDASVVKEKLGFACLVSDDFEGALAQFNALVLKEPENPRHHLHCAFALSRLERFPQVEKALIEASRLDPKDVRVALSLVDFYIGRGRTNEAVNAASAMIPKLDPGSLQVVVFALRKVEARAKVGHDIECDAAIDEVSELVRTSADKNLGAYVSSQLAEVAAKLFATKRPGAANRLLARCAEFNPDSKIDRPMPSEVRASHEALPSAFRAWLETTSQERSSPYVLQHNVLVTPILLGLVSLGALVGALALFTRASIAVDPASFVALLIGTALTGAAFAYFVTKVLRVAAAPVRAITTLHPLYLVRTWSGIVELNPLFMLTNTHGVHQHTNGVYTGTQITLTFGDTETGGNRYVNFSVRGQESAQNFLNALLEVRGRSLELLAEGALEAEHLVEDLPPAALATLPAPPGRARGAFMPLAIGFAVAALCAMPIAAFGTSAEDAALAKAASTVDPAMRLTLLRDYLARYPRGKQRAIAESQLRGAYEGMIEGLKIDPSSEGEAALVKAVEHLRDAGGVIVVDADVDDTAFCVQPQARDKCLGDTKREAIFHVKTALAAAGLTPILAPVRPIASPADARIRVKISRGPKETLAASVGLTAVPKESSKLVVAPVPAMFGTAMTHMAPPPSSVDAYGARVELTIEIAGRRIFERVVDAPPPTFAAAKRGGEEAAVHAASLSSALDTATRGLGLHAPMARIAGGR